MVVLVRLGVLLLVGMMMMMLLLPTAPPTGAAAAAQKEQRRASHLERDEGKGMGQVYVSGCKGVTRRWFVFFWTKGATNLNDV